MIKRNIHQIICGLYAIVDAQYIPLHEAAKTTVLILNAGCRLVQLRAKTAPASPLPSPLPQGERELTTSDILMAACAMQTAAASAGAVFIMNDNIDIAIKSKANGVHIGQTDANITHARSRLGVDAIIGVSTHNIKEAIEAEAAGADYISFGPIFPTQTKLDADRPKGLAALAELRRNVNIPIVAIGGITEDRAPDVIRHGANAVAVISDILLAKDIRQKTAALIKAVRL